MRLPAALVIVSAQMFSSLAHADLVLSAAPREDAAEGSQTYGPLAERLSAVLGEKVVYEHPRNWAEYADKVRHDHYDILMDGPHLTSWRMKHTGFTPLARLPGYLAFKYVALKGNKHFDDAQSIRYAKVCAFATPNLTAVALLDQYRLDVVAPRLVEIKGEMDNILAGVMNKQCDVAVLRDQFYTKMTDEQRAQVKVIGESRKFPNQGISTSSRVTEVQRHNILEVLQGDPSVEPITARFSKNSISFVPAQKKEYESTSGMLEGVVWGW